MAQRAHRANSDPNCQPGENALSSKERFGVTFPTTPPARRAGILQEEAAGTPPLCLCHCSTMVQPEVCTRHFLLLPERLFSLALGKASAHFTPKTSRLWGSGIMNMMVGMKSRQRESQNHCCPDYAVLEQSHKRETPTPVLRNVRLASASHPPKNKGVSFVTEERVCFQCGFESVG